MGPDASDLRDIVAAGVLAPSAENRHFLRFAIEVDRVEFLTTDEATWAEFPHRKMLALISYGAVAENMALRSAELGWEQHFDWFPDPARPDLLATLHWTAANGSAVDPLTAALPMRHTHRGFYRRQKVDESALESMRAAADAIPNARLVWLDDPGARKLALAAIRLAETERFRRHRLHDELFGAVRFDVGWVRSAPEGLPPATLGIEPALRLPFAQLRHWSLMRALTMIGVHRALGMRAGYVPCALAPHLGMIVADSVPEEAAYVQAGRALERTWLAAATRGLAFQPMAAATALSRQRAGSGWVGVAEQSRLRQLLARLPGGGTPCMLFRVGSASEPPCVTGRPPADRFMTDAR